MIEGALWASCYDEPAYLAERSEDGEILALFERGETELGPVYQLDGEDCVEIDLSLTTFYQPGKEQPAPAPYTARLELAP